MPSAQRHPTLLQSYGERSERANLTPLATYLLRLMHIKRTNLCVSADVYTTAELLQLAEDVGDQICVLKTHADTVDDFSDKTKRRLTEIAKRKKFVLFEDRKLGDIGSMTNLSYSTKCHEMLTVLSTDTVQQQYTRGPQSIVRWAHIVNAHLLPGPSIITALAEGAKKAIAAHNTSVQTDISASPPPSVVDGPDDGSVGSGELDEGNDDPEPYSDIEEDIHSDRMRRKPSVVSVSTTISTKSEALIPPSLSRNPSEDDDDDDTNKQDREAQLEELGPPPFYRSLLLLAQMSNKDNLATSEYTAVCVKHARSHREFVMGFIAQESLNSEKDDNFITMTPGVQLSVGGDALGQQYNTPQKVIGSAGCDIIIVGRGVLGASDRRRAAHEYRKQGWAAYENRVRAGRVSKK